MLGARLRLGIAALIGASLIAAQAAQTQPTRTTRLEVLAPSARPWSTANHERALEGPQTPATIIPAQPAATAPSPAPRAAQRVTSAPRTPAPRTPTRAPHKVALQRTATGPAPGGVWACIRQHESGGNYAEDTGNGYYGALQWAPGTWNSVMRGMGLPRYANGRADLAPPSVQDAAGVWLQARAGWSPWPNTSRMCGV
jgi:hypothetical protein